MIHALTLLASLASAAASAAAPALTEDMIRTALSSAHISTAPGAELKLLDRRTGTWHDFSLRRFVVRASGHHATIDIDVD